MANQKQLNQMMRQVQKMQADMVAAQEALGEETVEASVGGGMVTAVVSGTGDLKKISISPDVVDPDDVEMLEDLVVAAVAEAMLEAKKLQAERIGAATGGLDLDSLMGGLGGLLGPGPNE